MATNPVGAGSEQVTLNVHKGTREAYGQLAEMIGTGVSKNSLMAQVLRDALESGFAREVFAQRAQEAITAFKASEAPTLLHKRALGATAKGKKTRAKTKR